MIPEEDWRFGHEPAEHREPADEAANPEPARVGLSHARLNNPVYVVTAEHLGWYAIATWAVLTRLLALGARPLDPVQAQAALLELAIARDGLAAIVANPGLHASWPEILQAWIFATFGANDLTSRIVLAACALLLIAATFVIRPYLGRAGALASAAMLALSPSLTYYSRGSSTALCSLAFMMVSIALALSMRRRRYPARAIGLGCAIALWLSADPIGYATAATVLVSLAFIGLFDLLTVDHRRLRLRIWWEQRRTIVLITAMVALFVWFWMATGMLTSSLSAALARDMPAAFSTDVVGFERGIRMFIPLFGFYEFLIAVLAIVGAIVIAARAIVGPLARWSIVWAIVSVAFFLSIGATTPDGVAAMIIPLALVAGFGVEWMHDSARWVSIRIPLAAFAALTLYIQVMTNFVFPAPDASEKPWNRHALLFWSEPATTIQTPLECARARASVSSDSATAMIPDDAPQISWYLRSLAPTDIREAANIAVSIPDKIDSGALGNPSPSQFGFEESWTPAYDRLTVIDAFQYLFTQRVWRAGDQRAGDQNDVQIRDLDLVVRRPSGPPAATVILAPESSPLPVATPTPTPSSTSD